MHASFNKVWFQRQAGGVSARTREDDRSFKHYRLLSLLTSRVLVMTLCMVERDDMDLKNKTTDIAGYDVCTFNSRYTQGLVWSTKTPHKVRSTKTPHKVRSTKTLYKVRSTKTQPQVRSTTDQTQLRVGSTNSTTLRVKRVYSKTILCKPLDGTSKKVFIGKRTRRSASSTTEGIHQDR